LRSPESLSFWPLVKSQLSKHEAERFLLLHNVRSDLGRARAWLRAALNEHSLERYILIVLSFEDLHLFYHDTAFLRDDELSSILPQTAAGLGSVLFALSVDNPELDKTDHVMDSRVSPKSTVTRTLD
jgi:sorting nexin-29